MELKQGTLLQGGEFKIIKKLGQGGFGITYLAYQDSLDRNVAIKEFFMKDYCHRSEVSTIVSVPTSGNVELVGKYKERFKREAKFTARLSHPHIVSIYSIFEENDTVYYVMEYLSGGSLSEFAKGRALSEAEAIKFIRQIGDALQLMHSNRENHLDVKPGNIMLRNPNNAVLIDFGLTKIFDENGKPITTTSSAVGHTPGYAPLEQLDGVKDFQPTLDVYSLGATLYRLVVGKVPPTATEIFQDDLPELPEHLSDAVRSTIVKAMQPRKKDRQQSIAEFLAMLNHPIPSAEQKNSDSEATIISNSCHNEPYEKQKNKVITDTDKMLFSVGGCSFNMIAVEGGAFIRGSSFGNFISGLSFGNFISGSSFGNKTLIHEVRVSDFWMGETQVTQELWKAVMGNNPSHFTGNLQCPVERVSWDDCQEFVDKLNALTEGSRPLGMKFRLPTEAEWEYVARGGKYKEGYEYSGSNDIDKVAWYGENSGKKTRFRDKRTTQPVAQKQPNALGIYDMSGNVWEWCEDWYLSNYYSYSPEQDPLCKTPGEYSFRVLRGGSWYDCARLCRVSDRNDGNPDGRYYFNGMRLALSSLH